jgi:hypothetical protein
MPDDFFADAVKNSEDITDRYLNRAVLINNIVGNSCKNADEFRHIVRMQLEDPDNGYLGNFAEVDQTIIDEVKYWHRDGLIGAVDGSDSISLTLLPDKLVYGVAISTATSKRYTEPTTKMTFTSKQQKPPANIDDLFDLQDLLQDSSEKSSWARTYREFEERQAALDLAADGCRLVLIDGPIYTQNLMTQAVARDKVLDRIKNNRSHFIGYIKEQNPFHKQLGAALERGEYFVFEKFKDVLTRNRFKDQTHPAVTWVKSAPHWVRCIYKFNQKAYEFECDPALVPYGLALLIADPSDVLDHDIPFLLELVDKHVGAGTNAGNIAKDLVGALGQFALTYENERELRR